MLNPLVDKGFYKENLKVIHFKILDSLLQGNIFMYVLQEKQLQYQTKLYADDINSISSETNINFLQMKCNNELNHLALWYRANKLSVHDF